MSYRKHLTGKQGKKFLYPVLETYIQMTEKIAITAMSDSELTEEQKEVPRSIYKMVQKMYSLIEEDKAI